MRIKNRDWYFSFVTAGKMQEDDIIEDWENPKFGRYWWFWIPTKNYNGGKFKEGHTVCFDIMWLCFSIGFTSFYCGGKK